MEERGAKLPTNVAAEGHRLSGCDITSSRQKETRGKRLRRKDLQIHGQTSQVLESSLGRESLTPLVIKRCVVAATST